MGNSRSKNSKRNIGSGVASCISTIALGFILRTIVLYVFNEKYLGLTSVFTSLVSVLNMAELGFSTAIVVSMYKPLAEGNTQEVCALLAYYKKICKWIGFFVLGSGIVISPFIPYLVGGTRVEGMNVIVLYLIYLADVSVSYFLFAYKTALLTANQRLDLVKNTYTLVNILKSAVQIIILIFMRNFYLYILVTFFATLLSNFVIFRISVRVFPKFICYGELGREQKNNIRKHVGGLAIYKLGQVARNSFDTLILSVYFGLSNVAMYNNYFYIFNSVCGIMWAITGAMQASVADSIVSESVEKNYQDMKKFEFIFGWIITWCTSCLICLYQPFMTMWAGSELVLEKLDMLLFCLYFYFMMMGGIRNIYFDGLGLWWIGRKIAVSEAIANLVLNLVLGRIFGITGILFATIITIFLFNYVGFTNLVFKEYFQRSPKEFYLDRTVYTLVTIIVCFISKSITEFIVENGILGILFKFVACSIITNGLLLLVYNRGSRFLLSFQFLKKIILGRN